jgi:alpha-L-fucosidase
MKHLTLLTLVFLTALMTTRAADVPISKTPLPDAVRGKEIADMKWGMFVCWSFSTFSGKEWTPGITDIDLFNPTGCDTDQWVRIAKEAGMGYILFLAKHHDGFCLWDTATTDRKVGKTKAMPGRDVLAELRKSCDKHGIKLALYFSEGEWAWPDKPAGGRFQENGGYNPEMKKAQLKELLTRYGPVEFIWFDHAIGDGGLSHAATDKWVRQFQPNCFSGFNSGEAGGRIVLRERGKAGPLGGDGLNWVTGQGDHEKTYPYTVAEFTYPLLGKNSGASGDGADWFYSKPKYDGTALPASKIYQDYLGAVKYSNIFSLNVGPDYAGRLREIDVKTLREVGRMIRSEIKVPVAISGKASASGTWSQPGYEADKANDDNPATRWGAEAESRSAWLAIDLGGEHAVSHVIVDEAGFDRVRKFEIQAQTKDGWRIVSTGTTLGSNKKIVFPAPVKAGVFRIQILDATDVPTLGEFQCFE